MPGEEAGRVLEELLDLVELLDGLVGTGHVGEGHLGHVLGGQLGARLAELHHPVAATLHLAHEEPEQAEDNDHRQDQAEHRRKPVLGVDLVGEALGRRMVIECLDDLRTTGVDVEGVDLRRVLDPGAVGVGDAVLERELDPFVVDDAGGVDLVRGDEIQGGGRVDPRITPRV